METTNEAGATKPKRTRKKATVIPITTIVVGAEQPESKLFITDDRPDDAAHRAEFLAEGELPENLPVIDENVHEADGVMYEVTDDAPEMPLQPLAEPEIENTPIVQEAPIKAEIKPPAPKNVHFKIAINQKGLDVANPIENELFAEFIATKIEGKPFDVAYMAGYMAQNLFRQLKLFKDKKAGFNVTYTVDNTLVEGFNTKARGNFKLQTASDLAFGIANIIVANFDTEDAASLLTGNVKHSDETRFFVDRLGILNSAKQLPLNMLMDVVDVKRRSIKKSTYATRKEVLASMK